MSNAARFPVPTVTPRGVALASRALFAYLGALLAPLMAQFLFGPRASVTSVALSAGLGAIAGGLVGRLVMRPVRSVLSAAAKVLFASLVLGVLCGVASGLLWMTVLGPHTVRNLNDGLSVGVLFGSIFGLITGAAFAAPFALWTARARAALDMPSATAAQRLAMEAGVMLAAGGALAVLRYRDDTMAAFGVGTCLAGTVIAAAALVRSLRLRRLVDAVDAGELSIAPRGEGLAAPALADVGPLDHVLVAPLESTGPAPFRVNENTQALAAVPADLALVRRALGSTIAYGLVMVALTGIFDASLIGRALSCCNSGCASEPCPPCGGCAH